MAGIFDSIWDGIKGIGDAIGVDSDMLKSGVKAAGSAMSSNKQSTTGMSDLDRGLMSLGISNNFNAKTAEGAPLAVNSEALESQWLSRLNKFGSISSSTEVKGAK